MRVISKTRLKQFWESPGHNDAEGPLRAWYTNANSKTVAWHSWADVKADFSSASLVGRCVVFNIGGNKYRLITRVHYVNQKVYVLKVMPHKEYDEDKWKDQCGCFVPPPESEEKAKDMASKPRRKGY